MTRHPIGLLLIALGGLLLLGAFVATREAAPDEHGLDLVASTCIPAEPPVSRLGCAP